MQCRWKEKVIGWSQNITFTPPYVRISKHDALFYSCTKANFNTIGFLGCALMVGCLGCWDYAVWMDVKDTSLCFSTLSTLLNKDKVYQQKS
jgi:hypothetical protein